MSKEQCLSAIQTGMDAAKSCMDRGMHILATGEMGIGNTTTSSALLCALTGAEPVSCTGRGSGLSEEGFARKLQVIEAGLSRHLKEKAGQPLTEREDVFAALRRLGGPDIAALCGVFIGAAICGIPVVIDGLISGVAALTAEKLVPGCREFMLASHMGREKGMQRIMEELLLHPVLHADLALGEGTGAVMLFPLLDMALSLYTEGTAFGDTPIDRYERFQK